MQQGYESAILFQGIFEIPPGRTQGKFRFVRVRLKPDRATGTHGLPLRGSVIETAVPPDTVKIPAELFFAFEKVKEWEEQV